MRTAIVLIGLVITIPALAQRPQPLPNPAPQIPSRIDPDNPLNYPPPVPPAPRPPAPSAYSPDYGRPFTTFNNGHLCQRQGQVLICY